MTLEPKKRKPLTRDNPLEGLSSGDLAPHRQCPAMSKRTGERCKNMLSVGKRTCRMHGSATRKSGVAAAKRIAKASGYAADMLVEFMADPTVDVKLRTSIAQDLLNRANVVGTTAIQLEIPEWEKRIQGAVITGAVVAWGEVANMQSSADPNVIDGEVVEDWQPQNATLHVSERPDPHREQRLAEVEREVANLPAVPEPTPPWLSDESPAATATRLADEHRKAAFAAEKASNGLAPRTTRRR